MIDLQRLSVIDTHTGGEPTRVVIDAEIDIKGRSAVEKIEHFARELDPIRQSILSEPRAGDHWVAAWLFPSTAPGCEYGVLFMNNVGYLGMCGHGLIGVAVALADQGRLAFGKHTFETCVGQVAVDILDTERVAIQNVASYRYQAGVPVQLSNGNEVHGDIAWGGNWFFLCEDHGLTLAHSNLDELTQLATDIRHNLAGQGITGAAGAEIDHIELMGASHTADSRNFVLCPGKEYDRSPCGTGTSAKLACLAADGKLSPGEIWRQESVIGSVFEGSYQFDSDDSAKILPKIVGSAHVSAEAKLRFDPADPFRFGVSRS